MGSADSRYSAVAREGLSGLREIPVSPGRTRVADPERLPRTPADEPGQHFSTGLVVLLEDIAHGIEVAAPRRISEPAPDPGRAGVVGQGRERGLGALVEMRRRLLDDRTRRGNLVLKASLGLGAVDDLACELRPRAVPVRELRVVPGRLGRVALEGTDRIQIKAVHGRDRSPPACLVNPAPLRKADGTSDPPSRNDEAPGAAGLAWQLRRDRCVLVWYEHAAFGKPPRTNLGARRALPPIGGDAGRDPGPCPRRRGCRRRKPGTQPRSHHRCLDPPAGRGDRREGPGAGRRRTTIGHTPHRRRAAGNPWQGMIEAARAGSRQTRAPSPENP